MMQSLLSCTFQFCGDSVVYL